MCLSLTLSLSLSGYPPKTTTHKEHSSWRYFCISTSSLLSWGFRSSRCGVVVGVIWHAARGTSSYFWMSWKWHWQGLNRSSFVGWWWWWWWWYTCMSSWTLFTLADQTLWVCRTSSFFVWRWAGVGAVNLAWTCLAGWCYGTCGWNKFLGLPRRPNFEKELDCLSPVVCMMKFENSRFSCLYL